MKTIKSCIQTNNSHIWTKDISFVFREITLKAPPELREFIYVNVRRPVADNIEDLVSLQVYMHLANLINRKILEKGN